MAFRIALQPTYETEVVIAYPVEGGQVVRAKFFARFRRLSQKELDALMRDVQERQLADQDVLDRVLAGWRGVQDENGAEIDFDDEAARAQVLDVYPMRPSLAAAFFRSIALAREKN